MFLVSAGGGLLILSVKNDLFCVDHVLRSGRKSMYTFSSHVIPGRTCIHIYSLGLFPKKGNVRYALDEKQDKAIADVLTKLIPEKESSYIFNQQLKVTYLVELIHIITKIQQHDLTTRFL